MAEREHHPLLLPNLSASILTIDTHSLFSNALCVSVSEAYRRNTNSSSGMETTCFIRFNLSRHRRVAIVYIHVVKFFRVSYSPIRCHTRMKVSCTMSLASSSSHSSFNDNENTIR